MIQILLFAVALSATPAPQPTAASGCVASESRQFDFWVGEWDVKDLQTGVGSAHSRIERLYGGCAIRESWVEPSLSGGSLNAYSRLDQRWHQMWVDQSGAVREFVGGLEAGKMVLVTHSRTGDGRAATVRMTFTPNPDGTVRQFSDYSLDAGATWKVRYDYLYSRARPK